MLVFGFICSLCGCKEDSVDFQYPPKGWISFWDGDIHTHGCRQCVAVKFSRETNGPPENVSGPGSHPCVPGNVCNDRPCTEGPVELAVEEALITPVEEALITSDEDQTPFPKPPATMEDLMENCSFISEQLDRVVRNTKRKCLRELLGEG